MNKQTRAIAAEEGASAVVESTRRRFLSGRRVESEAQFSKCENCGAPLTGLFCAQCGQHAIDYSRSIWRVLVDAADSFFNWDTKFFSTLAVLITRPWTLTNDFNAGKRVRYVHPLRLYLLASIAFFLVVKMLNVNPDNMIRFEPQDRTRIDASLANLAADPTLTDEQRAKVEKARANLAQATGTTSAEDRQRLEDAMSTLVGASMKEKRKPGDRAKFDAALDRAAQMPVAAPDSSPAKTSAKPDASASAAATPAKLGRVQYSNGGERGEKTRFDWMESRIKDKIGADGTKAKLFLETLRSNIPTMMLCCIPLFAFILKVLYIRQRRFYVEHLIYALHIHSFVYIAVLVIALLAMGAARWLPGLRGVIIGVLSGVAVVQVFLSIRRVHKQGWFFSAFKFLVGAVIYFVILVLAVGATAFVTLLLPD